MQIHASIPTGQNSEVPLEKLAGSKRLSESEKVAELSRQFEAILVRQIITEAQKPAFKSKYNPQSTIGSIRQDMVANQMADNISKAGGLGLGPQLQSGLNRQAHVAHDHGVTLPLPVSVSQSPASTPISRWKH